MPSVRHHQSDGQKPPRARSQALGLDGLSPRGPNELQAANRHYESYQLGSTSTRTSLWLPTRSSGLFRHRPLSIHCSFTQPYRPMQGLNTERVFHLASPRGSGVAFLAWLLRRFGHSRPHSGSEVMPVGSSSHSNSLTFPTCPSSPALSSGSSALVRSSAHDRRARSRVRFSGSTSTPLSCNSALGHLWNRHACVGRCLRASSLGGPAALLSASGGCLPDLGEVEVC